MNTYAALLRGINVSGQKIIKMDHLRSVFESMEFRGVKTYIQSGNVIFRAETEKAAELGSTIESVLEREFGFHVPVILRTDKQLADIIKRLPYPEEQPSGAKIYVSFLSHTPTEEAIRVLDTFKNEVDDYKVLGTEVYILCRGSYGKSQFSNNFLEKKLKVGATTRNWQSIKTISDWASQETIMGDSP